MSRMKHYHSRSCEPIDDGKLYLIESPVLEEMPDSGDKIVIDGTVVTVKKVEIIEKNTFVRKNILKIIVEK